MSWRIEPGDITDNESYNPRQRTMPAKMCDHHKPKDLGYIAWHEWAADMNRRGIKQSRCPYCKLYFFPEEMNGTKQSEDEDTNKMAC